MGIVFWSLAPVPDPELPEPFDRLPHTAAYAVLTIVLLRSTLPWSPGSRRVPWLRAIGLALCLVVIGTVMELAQSLVGRDSEMADALANAIGIGLALAVWLVVRLVRTFRERRRIVTSDAQ